MVWDKDPGGENLSKFDREMLGQSKRLTIPVTDRLVLRKVADLLRGLANVIDFESRRPDNTARSSLFRIATEVDSTNRKIRYEAQKAGIDLREGRPANSKR